jgi:hypothetical protein
VPVNHIINKGAYDINEAIHTANGVISVRLVHVSHSNECREDFVVPEACVQVHVIVLDVASRQVNRSRLSCD